MLAFSNGVAVLFKHNFRYSFGSRSLCILWRFLLFISGPLYPTNSRDATLSGHLFVYSSRLSKGFLGMCINQPMQKIDSGSGYVFRIVLANFCCFGSKSQASSWIKQVRLMRLFIICLIACTPFVKRVASCWFLVSFFTS